jgi:rfaE bifunctional protein nucleotidyltransferase chain/domain
MINNQYYDLAYTKIIRDPVDLREAIKCRHVGSKVVLVKGVYDLFHVGHFYSFANAKMHGDILVVAVNADVAVKSRKGEQRPLINQEERMLLIAALSCVDWVTLYSEKSPFYLLKTLCPDVFAASHFDSMSIDERLEIEKQVILQIIPKLGEHSTTKIISKISGGG